MAHPRLFTRRFFFAYLFTLAFAVRFRNEFDFYEWFFLFRRGLTPPHRVKSISMATFSSDEIDFIRAHGNESCAKTWLGLWDPKRVHKQEQRDLIVDKYEKKR